MFDELLRLGTTLPAMPEVRAVLLSARGRAFCAGADLNNPSFGQTGPDASPLDVLATMNRVQQIIWLWRSLPQPTVVAVNGAAVGAGCGLALAADIRLAAPGAGFRIPYSTLGLGPDCGLSWLVPRLVGTAHACEWLFTGDLVDAATAERTGLVNRVVAADALEASARELALRLAAGPPVALRLTKAAIYSGQQLDLPAALTLESHYQAALNSTRDATEGILAARERRPPRFAGR